MKRLAIAAAALAAASAAEAAPGVDVGDLSGVVTSLVLVLGFIFAAAFIAKRTPLVRGARGNGPLKVVAALPLGAKERLLLVEARGRELLIAVSPSGVYNVGAPAAQREPAGAEPASPAAERDAAAAEPPKFVLGDPA